MRYVAFAADFPMLDSASKPSPDGKIAQLPHGRLIHYLDEGKGPAVVWLHGSGHGASGYSNFKHNSPFIAQNGYRCLVVDLIGFGYSDKPADVEYPLSFF